MLPVPVQRDFESRADDASAPLSNICQFGEGSENGQTLAASSFDEQAPHVESAVAALLVFLVWLLRRDRNESLNTMLRLFPATLEYFHRLWAIPFFPPSSDK